MKKILFYLYIGLLPNLILLLILYLYDPLQLYHQPFFRSKYNLDVNMRYQAAGIINTWNFDSAILGTSMLQNTPIFDSRQKLGGNWVNLSIPAGSLYERAFILKYLLKHQKIKQIMISIEPYLFLQSNKIQHSLVYDYLYDENPLNDFKIYLNEKYILCILKISSSCFKKIDPNYPIAWFNDPYLNQTFGGITQWIKKYNNGTMKEILKEILNSHSRVKKEKNSDMLINIDKNILEIIKTHQNIVFYLIVPPFSTLYYKLNNTDLNWKKWKEGLIFILNSGLKNIKIFGFDNENFTNKIENYKDLVHYNEKINIFMLDAIKNDTHRITLENIDSYFEEMKKKVEAYDIEPLRKQIIESGVLDK